MAFLVSCSAWTRAEMLSYRLRLDARRDEPCEQRWTVRMSRSRKRLFGSVWEMFDIDSDLMFRTNTSDTYFIWFRHLIYSYMIYRFINLSNRVVTSSIRKKIFNSWTYLEFIENILKDCWQRMFTQETFTFTFLIMRKLTLQ